MSPGDKGPTPPPPKRQKREQYRKAQSEVQQQNHAGPSGGGDQQQQGQWTGDVQMPKKRYYRQRAHANPFSDHMLDYPLSPAHMDWTSHFPAFVDQDPNQTNLSGARKLIKNVEVVDIGCGFGGLLVGLAPVLPDTLMLGMEIRTQVLEYLNARIAALRSQQQKLKSTNTCNTSITSSQPQSVNESVQSAAAEDDIKMNADQPDTPSLVEGGYQNISALRSNTMKFLPNFFARHQLSKIFICFPDPHFKARKHKARIITETLNAEYAYALRPGGFLYTITDVEEYHLWILKHFKQTSASSENEGNKKGGCEEVAGETRGTNGKGSMSQQPGVEELWERVSEEELQKDECVNVMKEETEEGRKVSRNKGNKFVAVFRRKANPEWP